VRESPREFLVTLTIRVIVLPVMTNMTNSFAGHDASSDCIRLVEEFDDATINHHVYILSTTVFSPTAEA
jgi:hypothetical protein